eukprot:gb/GECH01012667.1/.p1 GENE.gb/GECH01012667.1/~~gb/GECH01012667.1/.p1  ORF type:complete len:211 (+),score=38.71 gb/GECH01012667.1/:1-633(+)
MSFQSLINDSNGRDKVNKVIQYGAKALSPALSFIGYKNEAEMCSKVSAGFADGRKIMRLFKPLPAYQQTISLISKGAIPSLETLLAVLKDLCMAHYFLFDHAVWLSKRGILVSPKVTWPTYSFSCWLLGLTFSLILLILKTTRAASISKTQKLTLIQVLSDMIIAASLLGLIPVPSGYVGVAGVISGVCGGIVVQQNLQQKSNSTKQKTQ